MARSARRAGTTSWLLHYRDSNEKSLYSVVGHRVRAGRRGAGSASAGHRHRDAHAQSDQDIPAAVDVVDQDAVQLARQQIGLDESLAQVPGLFMQDRYNFAQDLRISIRGFGARANFGIRGVRIFVDGIPETLPDGQGQVDSVDLGSVERITVLRGSASALYGNAAGGVILIDSEQPPEQTTVDARAFLRASWASASISSKFGGTAGKLGYMVNLADLEMDGYREHSAVESRSVNGALRYAIGADSNFRVAFNYTDQPVSDDPGALTLEEIEDDRRLAAPAALLFDGGENLEQTRIGFVYDKAFGTRHSITARNYYVWRTFENTLAFQAGGAVTIDRFFVGGGVPTRNHGTLGGRDNRVIRRRGRRQPGRRPQALRQRLRHARRAHVRPDGEGLEHRLLPAG